MHRWRVTSIRLKFYVRIYKYMHIYLYLHLYLCLYLYTVYYVLLGYQFDIKGSHVNKAKQIGSPGREEFKMEYYIEYYS